jgi:hypothetical protein
MKLYHFNSPENYNFAEATRRGTWYPQGVKICPECDTSRQKRVPPLIIEWEAGSEVIGDFVWPGLNLELVITDGVKNAIEGQFREIEFWPVVFFQNPKLHRPNKITKRSKPRVWLPYNGPVLWNVIPTVWCHLDHIQSNVSIAKICSTCGKTIYKIPPWYQRRLVIDRTTWNGEGIFHIYEYSGGIFCTERVKEYIEAARFNNVSFLEDGVIPD